MEAEADWNDRHDAELDALEKEREMFRKTKVLRYALAVSAIAFIAVVLYSFFTETSPLHL